MNNQRIVELTLLLLAAFITLATVAVAAVAEGANIEWAAIPYLSALLLMWGISHLSLRKWAPTANGLLFPITALLQGLGVAFVLRIDPDLLTRHLVWSLFATVAFIAVLVGLRDLGQLRKLQTPLGLTGLVCISIPVILKIIRGEVNSYPSVQLGSVAIEPSHMGTLCLVIFFAGWLASYRSRNTAEYLGEADRLDGDPSRFIPLIGAWLLISVVVIFQSNLSAAFVLVAIFLSMWWVAVGRPIDLAFFVAAVVGSVLLAIDSVPEFQDRFDAWTDPWSNSQFGEAISRSSFALAGGGLTGTGPGEGSADWVSGATDQFAFVPIAEELGFMGGAAVLSSYLLLAGVGLRLATAARKEFESLLAIGIAIFFGSQAWAAIAVPLRFLPPNGLSLPFVASNGPALFTCSIALALLLRISETVPVIPDRTQILPRIAFKSQGAP